MFPACCLFAQNYITDSSQAKDFVQEVFVKLWFKFDEFNSEVGIKAYIYEAIKNTCLNHLEHLKVRHKFQKKKLSEVNSETYFFNALIKEETNRIIYSCIDELPEKGKEVILLSLKGLKNNEIAENLNVSINTVKTHKLKAYRLLKENLKHLVYLLQIISGI
jgi:RNA polymerase sigma-70 factor (ECF subfamily)